MNDVAGRERDSSRVPILGVGRNHHAGGDSKAPDRYPDIRIDRHAEDAELRDHALVRVDEIDEAIQGFGPLDVRDERREIANTLVRQRLPGRLLPSVIVEEFTEVQPRRRCIDGPELRVSRGCRVILGS